MSFFYLTECKNLPYFSTRLKTNSRWGVIMDTFNTILCIVLGIFGFALLCAGIAALIQHVRNDETVFLTPTKTATRALRRSFEACTCDNPPSFYSHEYTPSNIMFPVKEYYIVLRHPYERALSGFAFRKQGGENGDEVGNDATLFAQQYDTLEDLVEDNSGLTHLPLLEKKYQYVSYFAQKPGDVRPIVPICYPKLAETWPTLTDKFGCRGGCNLQIANTSNSSSYTLGPKTKEYIDTNLAGDVAIYEHFCGADANVTYS